MPELLEEVRKMRRMLDLDEDMGYLYEDNPPSDDDVDAEPTEEPSQPAKPEHSEEEINSYVDKIDTGEKATTDDVPLDAPAEGGTSSNINIHMRVAATDMRALQSALEKLKRGAKKFNMGEPIVTISKPYNYTYRRSDPENEAYSKAYIVPLVNVDVVVEGMFRLDHDHRLAAIVDNVTGVSYITDLKNSVPPDHLKVCYTCDHCGTQRNRGKTFVLQDGSGKYMNVGSGCLKQYLGLNPAKYISALNFFNRFGKEMGDDYGFDERGGGGGHHMSPEAMAIDRNSGIAVIYKIIEQDGGFIKALWQNDDRYEYPRRINAGESTGDKAKAYFIKADSDKVEGIDQAKVNEFLEAINTAKVDPNQGFGEFIAKIKAVIENEQVRIADLPILASAVGYVEKNKLRASELARKQTSQWVGNIGEKIKFKNVKLLDLRTGDGQYGTWFLWSLEDEQGNQLKKFGDLSEKFLTARGQGADVGFYQYKVGDTFSFTAEIKKQDEYNGVKTTQLGRLGKF